MSYTIVILPLIAALNCADISFLDTQQNSAWQPINQYQEILVNLYLSKTSELTYSKPHELVSKASSDSTEINKFLHDHALKQRIIIHFI